MPVTIRLYPSGGGGCGTTRGQGSLSLRFSRATHRSALIHGVSGAAAPRTHPKPAAPSCKAGLRLLPSCEQSEKTYCLCFRGQTCPFPQCLQWDSSCQQVGSRAQETHCLWGWPAQPPQAQSCLHAPALGLRRDLVWWGHRQGAGGSRAGGAPCGWKGTSGDNAKVNVYFRNIKKKKNQILFLKNLHK